MLTKEHVIEKVRTLPENILKEVNDFINFLEIKTTQKEDVWRWLEKRRDGIEESDFRDYLEGLRGYEDMLAKGEIKWK